MYHASTVRQARLLELLRTQTQEVTQRARLIRQALMFFLVPVALLIVCSLILVLSWFVRADAFFAATLFVLGLLSMLGGIIVAMMELRGALHPVELETQFVSDAVDPGIAEALQEAAALTAEEQSDTLTSNRKR